MCKLPFLTVSSVGRTEGVDKILSLKLGSLLSFSKIIIFIFENTIRKYDIVQNTNMTSRYLSFCSFWKGGVSRGPPVRGKVRVPPAGGGRWSVWIAPPSVDIIDI